MDEDLHTLHAPGENPETCDDCAGDAAIAELDDLPWWSTEYAERVGADESLSVDG